MRIAFLTTEFVTEQKTGGGLGSYLHRITTALCSMGHSVEVIVPSQHGSETIDFNGVLVHRVGLLKADNFIFKAINFILFRIFKEAWSGPAGYFNNAWHLSRALKKREQRVTFDVIQSSNCGASGLLVRKRKGTPHLVRLSSKRDLWFAADGKRGSGFACMAFIEKQLAGRADIVYAPSRFIARECTQKWRVKTRVLRPPVFIETEPAQAVPFALPGRFMVHFGTFARRKGSIVLARALRIVWEQAPDFIMVWCGTFADSETRQECIRLFGAHASQIILAGALEKDVLYAVIKGALAAVLPSLVDNLPNTVIESLLLGTPVIGTYDSSIDELVQHGVTGLLVARNSEHALAAAILEAWNTQAAFTMDSVHTQPVFLEMQPATAVQKLLCFDFEEISAGT
jgi:glycosyltransferase involved in cell wall biosynthesis